MAIKYREGIEQYEFSEIAFIIQTLLFSGLFFITYFNSKTISITLFKNIKYTYIHLNDKQRIEWDQRVVSMLHACLVLPLAIYVTYKSACVDIFSYQSQALTLLLSISSGYFIWDLYVCYIRPDIVGTAMIFHAIMGISANLYVTLPHGRPAFQPIVSILLLTEVSTIPLNIKGFLQAVNTKSKYYDATLFAFAVSFLLIRVVIGVPFLLYSLYALSLRINEFPIDKTIVYVVEAILAMCLNSYWGLFLAKKLFVKFSSGKPSSSIAKSN